MACRRKEILKMTPYLPMSSIREKSPNVQDYGEDRWKLLPALGSDYMSRRMIWPLVMVVAIRAAT